MKIIISIIIVIIFTAQSHAARCSDFANCRQAVVAWCTGKHNRADGDNDGIPCENVCKSRAQVKKIISEIGCNR